VKSVRRIRSLGCAVALTLLLAQCAPMPVGNVPGWRQVFTDDFTTNVPTGGFSGCVSRGHILYSSCSGLPSSVGSKWFAYPDGWTDTSGHGTYMPSQTMSIHDGVMDLYLHTVNGVHMVAAPLPKIPGGPGSGGGLSAGRFVIRYYADAVAAHRIAWMLWPDSGLRTDGEIDFPEGALTKWVQGFMHRQDATSAADQAAFSTSVTTAGWHTAMTEWKANDLTFTLDGKVIGHTISRVPNTPMHWVLQTETTLDGRVPTDADHGHVLIDWVAAYAPS
jgi:hypothetical protein